MHDEDTRDEDTPSQEPHVAADEGPAPKSAFDLVMRSLVILGLGAFITIPLWRGLIPGNFLGGTTFESDRPATFRAEREPEEEQTLLTEIAGVIQDVIRRSVADQEVDEVATVRQLSELLAREDLGSAAERAQAADETVSSILAQSAETSSVGFGAMQEQAIRGQSRLMARQLIESLGGHVEERLENAPPGNWETASWATLSNFEYTEGMDLPPEVRALDDVNAMAWGYLIFLERDQYLLVQSLWSCCFGRAPDLHEAIVVRAPADARQFEGRGVRIYGRLEVGEMMEDGIVTSLYRLDAEQVQAM